LTEAAPAPAPADTAPPALASAPAPTPDDWRSGIPEDIRSDPNIAKYETAEGFYRGHLSLVKMLGTEKVAIPKEGDEEGTQRFFKAAGWPDKPDGYGFKQPEKLPDGMVYNAELDGKLAGIFHGSKLTASQAAKVREGLMEVVSSGASESIQASTVAKAAQEAEMQKAEQALKQEWGQAFDTRAKVAGAAINKFAPPEAVAVMEANGLANNPAIVKMFYDIGTKLSGEKELIGAAEHSMAPADLDTAIADFRQKHGTALFDRSHADHALRTKEYTKLFERRFPNEAA
jgi:hypothetical protein